MSITLHIDQTKDSIALQHYVELVKDSLQSTVTLQKSEAQGGPILKDGDKQLAGALTIARYLNRLVSSKSDFVEKNAVTREAPIATPYITQWVSFSQVETQTLPSKDVFDLIEQSISSSTYIVGNSISLADIFVYVYVHSLLKDFTPEQSNSYPNFVRWFNLIQHYEAYSEKFLPLIHFDQHQEEFKHREIMEPQVARAPKQPKDQAAKEQQPAKGKGKSKEQPKEQPKEQSQDKV
ncbi:translation elongation factor 1 epsilon-1 [Acrasis kona]|uniref:Translation elongation factor 1 epsilon-1 n=1 Tax=Acrasis kona TaxID=1008807 RepID=A0AAW2ZNA4_9EUKA